MEPAREPDVAHRPLTVLIVDAVDQKTLHALRFARTLPGEVTAVHLERDPLEALELETAWSAANLHETPLVVLKGGGEGSKRLEAFVGGLGSDPLANVVIPVTAQATISERFADARVEASLTRELLSNGEVHVTLVRDHPEGTHRVRFDERGHADLDAASRTHTVAILVDRLDAAVIEAIGVATSLGASEVWSVHAGVDPNRVAQLTADWMDRAMPFPLDIVECWHRNVARTLERYVLDMVERTGRVTVIMPRRDRPRFRQALLPGRTGRKIQRALGSHECVEVAVVPTLDPASRHRPSVAPQRSVR